MAMKWKVWDLTLFQLTVWKVMQVELQLKKLEM